MQIPFLSWPCVWWVTPVTQALVTGTRALRWGEHPEEPGALSEGSSRGGWMQTARLCLLLRELWLLEVQNEMANWMCSWTWRLSRVSSLIQQTCFKGLSVLAERGWDQCFRLSLASFTSSPLRSWLLQSPSESRNVPFCCSCPLSLCTLLCHPRSRLMGAVWSERRGWLCLPPPALAGSPGGGFRAVTGKPRAEGPVICSFMVLQSPFPPGLSRESPWAAKVPWAGGDGGFRGMWGVFAQDERVCIRPGAHGFSQISTPRRKKTTLWVPAAAFGWWVISAHFPPCIVCIAAEKRRRVQLKKGRQGPLQHVNMVWVCWDFCLMFNPVKHRGLRSSEGCENSACNKAGN